MCEYLIGLDVVTANGEIKHCDEFENSDLFWAARGCGPGESALNKTPTRELSIDVVLRFPWSRLEILLQDPAGTESIQEECVYLSHWPL